MARRSKKGGEEAVKPVEEGSPNAFQVLAELEELGYTREEVVQMLIRIRDKGKTIEGEKVDKQAQPSINTRTVQKKNPSWAEMAEEEEREMGVENAPKSWA